jgi:hypothetical protein
MIFTPLDRIICATYFVQLGTAFKNYSIKDLMDGSEYNLKKIIAPKVQGFLLVIVAYLCRWLPGFASFLAKDTGIFDLRKVQLKNLPAYYPFDIETFLAQESDTKQQTLEDALEDLSSEPVRFFKSSKDFISKYKSEELSPVDVAKKLIEAILADKKADNGVHALCKFSEQDIMKQAKGTFLLKRI